VKGEWEVRERVWERREGISIGGQGRRSLVMKRGGELCKLPDTTGREASEEMGGARKERAG